VLKNKSFLDRSLYSTVRSDHRHGLNQCGGFTGIDPDG